MSLATMNDLLVTGLRDIYSAEQQLLKALPKMASSASSASLAEALSSHIAQTEEHVTRLEGIFEDLGGNPRGKRCAGMRGLIAESEEVIGENGDPSVIDAALIAAAQRMEHYGIAAYGSARTFAALLGRTDIAAVLRQSLLEEEAADVRLTQIALREVNDRARAASADSDEESAAGADALDDTPVATASRYEEEIDEALMDLEDAMDEEVIDEEEDRVRNRRL
ncbi:MAG TPA: ferritin-like domain-containing protein [Gemmatimonadaceae bacterium]|nr:ferritin-like domain-containing protein [Gemmatimonadaceae bacterium]